jgi:hypothetical protein
MKNFTQIAMYEASDLTNSKIIEMTLSDSNTFRKKFQEKFTEGKGYFPMWEHIHPRYSVREKDAWKWLDEFIQFQETYILFDRRDDPIVYILPENQSITKFHSEFPRFVCCQTNKNLDYVLTQNDSYYLIASGTAIDWLRQKVFILTSQGWQDLDKRSKPEEFE